MSTTFFRKKTLHHELKKLAARDDSRQDLHLELKLDLSLEDCKRALLHIDCGNDTQIPDDLDLQSPRSLGPANESDEWEPAD